MKFYSEEKINQLRLINKRRLIFTIVFCVFSCAVFGLSLIFLNDSTETIIKIIDCVFISLSLCILFYNLSNYILVNKQIIAHIQYVMVSNYEEVIGKVTEIKERKTINKNVIVKQILIKTRDNEFYINYNHMCNQIDIKMNDVIKVRVAGTFIIDEKEGKQND